MKMYLLNFIVCLAMTITVGAQTKNKQFVAGAKWLDTNGNFINAHSAGIMYHNGTYYWYGEIKKGKTTRVEYVTTWEDYRVQAGGVSCYSSKDLLNWKNEGVALAPNTTDSNSEIHTSKVIERPKVVYNERTKKFVMWMHIDKEDYAFARAGVAVSDKPEGPFEYLGSFQPNGNMARDITLFRDDDGKAYIIFSSENNETMHVCLLSDDYLQPTTNFKRILIRASREAPAICKYEGIYYLITSGTSGWSPNAAAYATATSMLGEWTQHDNPCTGSDAQTTYQAQSTFILPLQGKPGQFIFLSDRWNKTNLEDSRYLWLPMTISNGKPVIEWREKWKL